MSATIPTDSVGQPIEVGDVVVYVSGSRASTTKRVAQVIATKKKVKVHFFKGDTLDPNDGGPDSPTPYNWATEWLESSSLVVVTSFKTFKPRAEAVLA